MSSSLLEKTGRSARAVFYGVALAALVTSCLGIDTSGLSEDESESARDARATDGAPDGISAADGEGGGDGASDGSSDAFDAADVGFPVDAGGPCDGGPDCPRYVFVTSANFDGKRGGLAGADDQCQAAADGAIAGSPVKGRKFMAWLSATGAATANAADRLGASNAPYRRVDGALIANDKADLLKGTIANTISRDENGATVFAVLVWTGSTAEGLATGLDCGDWSLQAGNSGSVGNSGKASGPWSADGAQACNLSARLYCIEK